MVYQNSLMKQATLASLVTFVLKVFLTAHYFVCLWLLVGNLTLWRESNPPWLIKNQSMFESYDKTQLMIFSYYWVFEIFSTVGYGDFVGGTKYEYIITLMIEFLGLLIFSWITQLLENVLAKGFNYDDFIASKEKSC